ncbi:MAG: Radical domain protein [Candidatus Angelobacter sp.]|nr:Radical domain protein [Candidatus Angelobacter sp.]
MNPDFLPASVLFAQNGPSVSDTGRGAPDNRNIALVCMPWNTVTSPSVALGILKKCVQAAGFEVDVHYLNIKFAQQIGVDLYQTISDGSQGVTEWFFSPALFGAPGLGELANTWKEAVDNPAGAHMVNILKKAVGSGELCEELADKHVPRFIDECMAQVDWTKYLAVGFTTTFSQSLSSLLLAKRIKDRHPHINIIFGGANVDAEMGLEFMRGFPWVDFVVHGDAEFSFPSLLQRIASGNPVSHIPGVSMRALGSIVRGDQDAQPVADLNQSPSPDYSDYMRELEQCGFGRQLKIRLFFESSRGCWWGAKHHCTFCGLNGSTMAFRKKDPERVYAEIVELSSKYRCTSLAAVDNIMAMESFAKLLPQLAELDTDISLFYEVKANLTRNQLALMRAGGVNKIQPGIESLNTRLLREMKKGITAIQNIQMLKWCYEYDIEPIWNILYGFPGETDEDYKDLPGILRLLFHLRPPISLGKVCFERFSPYFYDREKYRLTIQPMDFYPFIFPQKRVDLEKVAYFFDGKWEGQPGNMAAYLRPVEETFSGWNNAWQNQSAFFYYEKGPDYLILYDSRPRLPNSATSLRRIYFDDFMTAIYLLCDENRTFNAIREHMAEKFADRATEQEIKRLLDTFVDEGLMFREGDRYLALAVRKKSRVSYRTHKAKAAEKPLVPEICREDRAVQELYLFPQQDNRRPTQTGA